ncbi:P-loop containing nucleoside triphosphate hydrolase protein [Fusarium tricinctum]|uniref:P-loop containing nucleoside triphosphate hydrolase protein n=2 Tax=Fusarium tricinctum species complex TaxID=679429 RepID=A0A8K0RQZ6_9HYPO|nr:P-loop containing nucleoside triphosphate hydrolase protein [Fusarium tricinctum]
MAASLSTQGRVSTYTVPDRIVPMRVIVCGVHRTGTLSIRNALWQLGFHDCYHMQTLFKDPSRAPEWIRALEAKYAGQGSFTRADWDRLLGDCQAVCDVPAAFFGAELAETYPEAKVIILNRDPEKWYESVLNSIYLITTPQDLWSKLNMIYCYFLDPNLQYIARYSKTMRSLVQKYDHGKDKDKALAWYKAQYQEFHDRIPAERYIEYTITEGWAPLCEYLGVPVPEVEDPKTGKMVEAPFPHLNDGETFRQQSKVIKKKTKERANQNLLTAVGRLALTGVVGYAGYLVWKTRLGGRV